ncbi:6571_t:CDS:2, partial [Gigaspora rosea]
MKPDDEKRNILEEFKQLVLKEDRELAEFLGLNSPEHLTFWRNLWETYRWIKYKEATKLQANVADRIVGSRSESIEEKFLWISRKLVLETAEISTLDEATDDWVEIIKQSLIELHKENSLNSESFIRKIGKHAFKDKLLNNLEIPKVSENLAEKLKEAGLLQNKREWTENINNRKKKPKEEIRSTQRSKVSGSDGGLAEIQKKEGKGKEVETEVNTLEQAISGTPLNVMRKESSELNEQVNRPFIEPNVPGSHSSISEKGSKNRDRYNTDNIDDIVMREPLSTTLNHRSGKSQKVERE